MKKNLRNIGIVVEIPKQNCKDIKCPFHGKLSLRGRSFKGIVVSIKARRTATIEFGRLNFLKKYERYEKKRTRLKVHNPDCIDAKEGWLVQVMECRPLSKTKNFVIIEGYGVEKGFKIKMEARETAKIVTKVKDEQPQQKISIGG